ERARPATRPARTDAGASERRPSRTRGAVAGRRSAEPVRPIQPEYPPRAVRRGLTGRVIVAAHVLPDGTPDAVRVERSSGHEILDRAAVEAVCEASFRPARRDAGPVAAWVRVPVRFVLHEAR
ncbi:MAG: energy transducer TonB, partial [Planctomycetota bacterium]